MRTAKRMLVAKQRLTSKRKLVYHGVEAELEGFGSESSDEIEANAGAEANVGVLPAPSQPGAEWGRCMAGP